MIPALEHKQTTRYLYVKQNLNDKFPLLALLLPKLRSFRPKILKSGARQKGTYCIQCVLKEVESKNLLSFDISNASEENIKDLCDQFEDILNHAYANGRTYTGSIPNKKAIRQFCQMFQCMKKIHVVLNACNVFNTFFDPKIEMDTFGNDDLSPLVRLCEALCQNNECLWSQLFLFSLRKRFVASMKILLKIERSSNSMEILLQEVRIFAQFNKK